LVEVSIAGASGYTGGELLRLLLAHPQAKVRQVTSEQYAGQLVNKVHPNLRKHCQLKFSHLKELDPCDLLFLCLPHGEAMKQIESLRSLAPCIIDLSGDFRLVSAEGYAHWYGRPHLCPELLGRFVYGIPELHREKMREAQLISSAGCNATAVILALYPLKRAGLIRKVVAEVKVGSSEGGNKPSLASHHPERAQAVRSFKPTGHRHTAEILQELQTEVHLSATTIGMVRGILATCHVFLNSKLDDRGAWKLFREAYGQEPFIRIVKQRDGVYRYPEPKLLWGTNWCDIGFEKDPESDRLVVLSAIDNLMKGAAGQALQAFNIMHGFPESTALDFAGLHPV
jgi:N-acetyl-gamma-glutamyl-phosphate/LysW-gamma-L-alpha-aminoadipyl-6-phosphate reductase